MGYYLIYDITINIALYSPDDFLISAMSEFEITERSKYTHPNVSNEIMATSTRALGSKCCVVFCESDKHKDPNIHFHRFPFNFYQIYKTQNLKLSILH